MVLLNAAHITKSFGVDAVLKDASVIIHEGQRVGLVGSNGSGKTTLLNIIAGRQHADGGGLTLTRGARIQYFTQGEDFSSSLSVWDELQTVFGPVFAMERRLRDMEARMGEVHDDAAAFAALSDDYAALTARFEEAGGYAFKSSMEGALTGLGFTKKQYGQRVDTLSGGEKTRLRLAKLLLTPCDLMLLDEPTNHLDLSAAAWLEDTLKAFKGAVLVVSHDRYFLDAVCQSVAELTFGATEQYEGNYTRFLAQRQEVFERRLKEYTIQQKEIERQKDIILRYRAYATEAAIKKAKTREHVLERMDRVDRPREESGARFSFKARGGTGNDVLMLEGVSKGYGGRTLFEGVTLTLKAGDRAALIGPNGAGKTTLLRVLMGMEAPDVGGVRLGARVQTGYYDQQLAQLSADKSVLDEVWDDFRRLEQLDIRSALAAFLLTGDDVFRPMDTLSGGERARVMLTKLMLRGDNFLVLDEPTNHLDMDSREALEGTLAGFDGTLLAVSHDRYFINKIATHIIELKDGGVRVYEGNYDDYMERKLIESLPPDSAEGGPNKTEERRRKDREREATQRAQAHRRRVVALEEEIALKERAMTALEAQMADPAVAGDYEAARARAEEYARLRERVEVLYEELDGLV